MHSGITEIKMAINDSFSIKYKSHFYTFSCIVHLQLNIQFYEKLYFMSAKQNLTAREWEVLQLIFCGYTDRSIAKDRAISDKTASTHRKQMLKKLQMKNTALLVRYAMENKLVK